jgi:hypothetical protein
MCAKDSQKLAVKVCITRERVQCWINTFQQESALPNRIDRLLGFGGEKMRDIFKFIRPRPEMLRHAQHGPALLRQAERSVAHRGIDREGWQLVSTRRFNAHGFEHQGRCAFRPPRYPHF